MSFHKHYNWLGLSPKPAPAPTLDTTLTDRALAVSVMVEALRQDPAWQGSSDADRRRDARHLLALRWAVRTGRMHEGQP